MSTVIIHKTSEFINTEYLVNSTHQWPPPPPPPLLAHIFFKKPLFSRVKGIYFLVPPFSKFLAPLLVLTVDALQVYLVLQSIPLLYAVHTVASEYRLIPRNSLSQLAAI